MLAVAWRHLVIVGWALAACHAGRPARAAEPHSSPVERPSGAAAPGASSPADGNEPASILSLIPADAGLCIEVDGLAQQWKRFEATRFYERLENFPPVTQWLGQEGAQLGNLADGLSQQIGIDREELWEDVVGQRAALAIWPGETPAGEAAVLLLLEAADAEKMRRTIDGFCQAQARSGDLLAASEVQYAGIRYRIRVMQREEGPTRLYLATVGRIGVVAGCQSLMRRTLDLYARSTGLAPRGATPPGTPVEMGIADLAAYRRGLAHIDPEAPIRLFVNPRPWDPLIAAAAAEVDAELPGLAADAPGTREAADEALEGALVRRAVQEVWQQSEYWMTSLRLGEQVAIESYIHFDRTQLSEPVYRLIKSFDGRAEFVDHIPAEAALAFAGRVDLAELSRLFVAVASPSGRDQLEQLRGFAGAVLQGLDVVDDVLGRLGPDLGAYLAPPAPAAVSEPVASEEPSTASESHASGDAGTDASARAQWVFGVRTALPQPGDSQPPVAQALDTALRAAWTLAALAESPSPESSAERVAVRTSEESGLRFVVLEGAQRTRWRLMSAYTFVDGYFLGGSDRHAVVRSATLGPTESLAASPAYAALIGPRLGEPTQLLYVDCRALLSLLRADPEFLASMAAASRGLDLDASFERLARLAVVLDLADTILAAARFDESGLAVRVVLSQDMVSEPGESTEIHDPTETSESAQPVGTR